MQVFSARGDIVPAEDLTANVRGKLKRLKSSLTGSHGAHIEALIDFGRLIPKLKGRIDSIEGSRKRNTKELLELMGEPFRPVIGHPAEKAYIESLEPYLRDVIG